MRSPRGTKGRIRWIGLNFRIINSNGYHLHTSFDWQFNHRGQNMDLVKLSINCQLLNNHFRHQAHAWKITFTGKSERPLPANTTTRYRN